MLTQTFLTGGEEKGGGVCKEILKVSKKRRGGSFGIEVVLVWTENCLRGGEMGGIVLDNTYRK